MGKKKNGVKVCIVKGCGNKSSQGNFIGDLCAPCHSYLATGHIGATRSFLGKMKKRAECYKRLQQTMRECEELENKRYDKEL